MKKQPQFSARQLATSQSTDPEIALNSNTVTKLDIVSIRLDAREDTEQLGSKPKFWVLLNRKRWLFKEACPNTDEDWAEKVAAEIGREIGI